MDGGGAAVAPGSGVSALGCVGELRRRRAAVCVLSAPFVDAGSAAGTGDAVDLDSAGIHAAGAGSDGGELLPDGAGVVAGGQCSAGGLPVCGESLCAVRGV